MKRPRSLMGYLVALSVVVAATPAFTASARAATGLQPPGDPAIAVYVEQIPTGSGSVAAGGASGEGTQAQPQASKELHEQVVREGGEDAGALEALVTSEDLGAPAPAREITPQQAGDQPAADPAAAPQATIASDRSGARQAALVVLLAFITAAVVYARLGARPGRGSGGLVSVRR